MHGAANRDGPSHVYRWQRAVARTNEGIPVGLRFKFNVVLVIVFALGMALASGVSYQLLQRNARREVLRDAGLMMEAALAIRGYTVTQVKPHLDAQLQEHFLPQAVAAFAATETFNALRAKYPEYSYKEATLNPTNPRDRAVDWEADVVNTFRNNPQVTEHSGERMTETGPMLYLARPIQVNEPGCLACHSTAAAAPASMTKIYGESNGFGWKFQEIVGAQVVSVPAAVPIMHAREAFLAFIGSLAAIFIATFVVLNVMLSYLIIRPIARMALDADRISTGDFKVAEFDRGRDEIGVLGNSFNRMRRSLQKALHMIEEHPPLRRRRA
jgi:protein-histidine pros-kinase